MERTQEIFETIERYLADSLSKDEVTQFEARMANDPELQQEVAMHKALHQTLSDQDTLDFKEKLGRIRKEMKSEEPKVKKLIFSSPLRIAAAIIVLLGVGVLFWNPAPNDKIQDLYAEHYTPFPIEDITRGNTNTTLQKIMKNYRNGQYDSVVAVLEKNTNMVELQELQIYLGNSYLNTDQIQKAIAQFESISKQSGYYEASRWYLSLAYLKEKDTPKVKEVLEKIIGYKGVYKDNATQLLQALSE